MGHFNLMGSIASFGKKSLLLCMVMPLPSLQNSIKKSQEELRIMYAPDETPSLLNSTSTQTWTASPPLSALMSLGLISLCALSS